MEPDPWRRSALDVVESLHSDIQSGLTAKAAAECLARLGPNILESAPQVAAWRKIAGQFRDPLTYLLLAAVTISFAAWLLEGSNGFPFEAIVIALIVVANAVLGYLQEARAEQAVAALQRMAAPMATVIREGKRCSVPASGVVPGDVLLLDEGAAVVADARLIEAASLKVAEAALTGESEPVLKDPATIDQPAGLGDRFNMVFAGTLVTSGRGRGVVTHTAMDTEMGGIARLLARTTEEPTPLHREVQLIGRVLGVAVVAIAIVVVTGIFFTSDIETLGDFVDVLLVGVSLAVAAVPEGLPVVLSLVLALGVQRMARERAIVKKLSSVEALGSASVICSDKTGTLTRNEMTLVTVVTGSGTVTLTGTGYRPEGNVMLDGRPLDGAAEDRWLRDEALAVLAAGGLANDAVLRLVDGEWTVQGDPTDGAFLVAEAKLGLTDQIGVRFARIAEAPFTSERKLMSSLETDAQHAGRLVIFTKGAPGVLLGRCIAERVAGETRALSEARRAAVHTEIEWLANLALRPLAVAYREIPQLEPSLDSGEPAATVESFEHGLTYLGVVGLVDPPREEARAAIDEAHRAGIRVLMITGDHPGTASRIADELGLAPIGSRFLTGPAISSLDEAELREAVREVAVYARVAPEHKLRIVDALQADGNVVAMTGDGVNDAPALRAADIGIAMGITGTEVSREAADIILADDNFATIVSAVREGRSIFANIRTFLRFLLSSNAGEVLTMFLGVVGARAIGLDETGETVAIPLLATQVLWINLLTDTAPALALGVDPPPPGLMELPPRRLNDRVIDGEMQRGIVFVGLVMALVTLAALDLGLAGGLVGGSGNIVEARTMAFTTLVLAQLFNCFNARSEYTSAFRGIFTNRLLWLAIAVSVLLQVGVEHIPALQAAFSTSALSLADWAMCVALASLVLWADEARKIVLRLHRGRG
ncbi:MAG: cation-translocating P-type ATPase [Tepidiformaceae bacterium]